MTQTLSWQTPAGCEASQCLEVAVDKHGVFMRRAFVSRGGTQQYTAPLWFSRAEFAAFIAAAKAGQYDEPAEP